MRAARFTSTLLGGHKNAALEVPFDPAERWGIEPVRLRLGRHGHRVQATIGDVEFETAVVPRLRRFWVEIDEETQRRADIRVGETISIAIKPVRPIEEP